MTDDPAHGHEPRFVEFPSPFVPEPGVVRLLEPPGGFGSKQLDQFCQGTLGQPFIIDYGHTRTLFFSLDAVQSAMRVDEPEALIAAYTRKMMAFLLFAPAPSHVLMLGLGGGSLAKFCYRHLPRTRITVVEISADVIALRDTFAIPADDERFEIIHEDGAEFLATTCVGADVILIDAFDAKGVSPSLATDEFCQSAHRCLTPEGLLVMNLSGQKSRYTAHVENLRTVFGGRVRPVPVCEEDNLLLFAFKDPGWAELPDVLLERAVRLERGLGLEFPRYLSRLRGAESLGVAGEFPA